VRLPLAREGQSKPAAAAPVEPAVASGHRVLVVDDNRDFAASLAMILRDMGNEVRVEYDGLEGLSAAEAFQPTIAFLDIGLPGISGYELAKRMRAMGLDEDSILVAVTGWGQKDDKARSTAAGFDYHVVKPLDPAELPQILRAAAEHRARHT
jgi:DNA-binding response OmpR family regulator